MTDRLQTLDRLQPGESAVIERLETRGSMRRRFCDIGLIEHTLVECLGTSPGGGISAYLVRGAVIAIRAKDARGVSVDILR